MEAFDFGLERLDDGVALLQIFVQAVALGDQLLLPLSETLLFHLDLLGESLPELLLFLLELGVIKLSGSRLAELACLHLLCAVDLIVRLFGRVDQVEHVGADEDGAELLEVAVLLILDLGNSPGVLAALDGAAIGSADVALRSYHGERHGSHQATSVLQAGLVILLEWWGVHLDALSLNDISNLRFVS